MAVLKFSEIKTNRQLAEYCGVTWEKLKMLAYAENVERYKEWPVLKKNGLGYRLISSPMGHLRSVQRAIAKGLTEAYDPPVCVYGFVEGRNVAMNALQHTKKRTVLTLDLKDFFPSITAGRVHGLFSKMFGFTPEVVNTLTNLVCHNKCLPQGAPTSPVISNIICFRMDRAFLSFAAQNNITYTRYADDLVFSTTSLYAARKLFDRDKRGTSIVSGFLVDTVESNGFSINDHKVHIANRGSRQTVNGIVVNRKCNIKREEYRSFRALFHRWKKFGLDAAVSEYIKKNPSYKSRLFENGVLRSEEGFIAHIRGRLDYYSMVVEANGRPSEPMAKLWTLYHEVTGEKAPYMTHEMSAVQLSYAYDSSQTGDLECSDSSGVICQGFLITCNHCLPKEEVDARSMPVGIEVRGLSLGSGFTIPVSAFKRLRGFDFAYAKIEDHFTKDGIELLSCDYLCQFGEEVIAVGYAGGARHPHCVKAGVRSSCSGEASVAVDRAFIKGMSGGPVFNSRHELIGIVAKGSDESSYARDGEFLAFNALAKMEPFHSLLK